MLTLTIKVPEARDRTAYATLSDATHTLATGSAVASASTAYGSRHANPTCDPRKPGGHPPFGRYQLIHHERSNARLSTHYGTHLLLFEPRSGAALDAESFGRLGLLVYGGVSRRRTQGGVRVTNDLLEEIVTRVEKGESVTLDIEPGTRAWWQFWKAQQPSEPVTGSIELPQAPDDELTLFEELLQRVPRVARVAAPGQSGTYDREIHRGHDSHDGSWSSRDSQTNEGFHGKGGDSGGGGASGTWSEAPGSGRGDDAAGRIVGAAAVVGAVAAAAALAQGNKGGEGAGTDSNESSTGDSNTTNTAY